MANQFYPYWGERLICKCSDREGGREFPAKKYFWGESTTTKPEIRQKIWLNKTPMKTLRILFDEF